MRKIFVISDTHWGHANIIKYCNRPFKDVHEMDAIMIDNWHATVKPEDIVYHLGDVYMPIKGDDKQARWDRLTKLPGRKRLILGNHDNGKNQLLNKMFEKIVMWRYFKEFNALLTHVPVHPRSLVNGKDRATVNFHGHIHNNEDMKDDRYKNVCVEVMNYKPVELESLI